MARDGLKKRDVLGVCGLHVNLWTFITFFSCMQGDGYIINEICDN